jgi:tRNA dimethylallyltransferase
MAAAAARTPLIVIAGPTAAGKTRAAIPLAERIGAEIVSADSQQVYRGMDIGTAKPGAAERARVPHHLLDLVEPDEQYDAARFEADALRAIAAIRARGRHVLVVGGTGLYVRALLEGLSAGVGRDPEVRRALEAEHARALARGEPEHLLERLREVDPRSASRLHAKDVVRIVRALEIHATTGRPASALRSEGERTPRFDALQIVLDPGPAELNRRIDARCAEMIEAGLLQEVRALRERGYGRELPSMRAIGYRHMQPVIDGQQTLANVLEEMRRDTRQLARRQRTWWRSVREAIWMHPDDARGLVEAAERFLARSAAPRADQPPPV